MKRIISLITCLWLVSATSWAQSGSSISGTVKDSKDNSPLSGVTVSVKGKDILTQTDKKGVFKIQVPDGLQTLVFTFVGFTDRELPASDNMQVSLSSSEKTLNEVVVVGYGKAVKRDVTGSISKVGSKDIQNVQAPSFESALQGKAAGVVIESGSGKLGQGIKVSIRGTSSISASSQPLYVIDGLPVSSSSQSDPNNDPTNPLADINPNDIESVEILKDASAAAIYGARAANGVVLITTKKGRNNQKTTFEVNAFNSWSNPAREWKFLNAQQYVNLIELAAKSDGTYDFNNGISGYTDVNTAIADYKNFYESNILDNFSLGTDWKKGAVNTDWQKLLYNKDALTNQVDVSAYGGDEKTKFYVSGFYNKQDAIVIDNRFYRYGGRLNIDHTATDKLSFGVNIAIDRSQLNRVTTDNAFSTPGQLVAQLPISPLYDPKTGALNSNTLYSNGLFDAQFNSDIQVTFHTLGNAYLNYNFLPSLAFRSEIGADILNLNEDAFQGKETIDGGGVGKANLIISQSASLNLNNYFTFTPNLGDKNKLNAVVGTSYLQNDSKNAQSFGENIPSDAIKNLSGTTQITFANSTGARYTFLSYFLRANYTFNNKYLLSASVRADASSRFGPNNRYGYFPAVSAGWIISEEKFLQNNKFINFLKLRASWGQTGNAEIGEGNYLALYGVSNYPNLPGYIPVSLANPDLQWEKTKQTDIGLDFAILNNRITGELDYYKKMTTDLLLNVNVPSTTGYSSYLKNLGSMENEGYEITLNSKNIDGAFKWNTNFNIGFNKNKVLDIQGQIIQGGFGLTQRAIAGQPIGVFYGQQFLGVDPQTGDALYLGTDGKSTSDYGQAALVVLGKSNPDFTGGFTNTFSYKGFDLSAFFTFVSGNKIYNAGGVYMTGGFFNGFDNQTIDEMNAWTGPGDVTNTPRAGYFYGSGYQNSSRFLYDGSYIRLKNVSLGYNLPKSMMDSWHISSARLYVAGVNLWTRTKYPGDPEVNTQTFGNIGGGQDFYTIPQAKTITVGLNVKF